MLTYPEFTPHFPRAQWMLPTVLEHQARERGDAPYIAWTDEGRFFSFAETNRMANRVAHGLRKLGVAKGDRVCIMLPNCIEYIFLWFGTQKIGAMEVAVSDLYKGAFLEHPLKLTNGKLIFATRELAHRLAEVEESIPNIQHCVFVDGGADVAPPAFKRITTSLYADMLSDDESDPGVKLTPRDPASILFTSGTTGPSKAVLMPHSQFYFFAEQDAQLTWLSDADTYITGFPLFHGNAQFLTVYPSLIVGARCVLYPRFSATDFIGRARRSGATVLNLLGATMAFILAQPEQPDDKDHKVTRIYAAPLSIDLADKFINRFGHVDWVDGFGQTEISTIFMTPRGETKPPGACGKLVAQWFEARLVDPETDEDVPEGQAGELVVRNKAPGIMSAEYYGMPEKTVETWRNLWFHTGDALKRDAQGWYYFVDRVKDALRRRGENISSFEVEAVVRSFPAVAECAVIGVKADEAAGEDEVMACIVPREGETVDFAELTAWCDKRMPAFMVPRYFEVMQALPQTPSEKVKKKELRERGVTPTTWDRVKSGVTLSGTGKTADKRK